MEIRYAKAAAKYLESLDRKTKRRILAGIMGLTQNTENCMRKWKKCPRSTNSTTRHWRIVTVCKRERHTLF